jgi:thioredoxin 1
MGDDYFPKIPINIAAPSHFSHFHIPHSLVRCGPCRMIAPKFEEMSKEYPGAIFVKVDVDAMSSISQECGIRAMPTFHMYKNGEKVDELVGANVDTLKQKVAALA